MKSVKFVLSVRQSADGRVIEWVGDGGNSWLDAYKAATDGVARPFKLLNSKLVDEDGSSVILPFHDSPHILPDRSGVLVIFAPGSYVDAQGKDIFAAPSNAAIFNADGSLRCQVKAAGLGLASIHSLHSMHMSAKFQGMAGVLACDDPAYPPELLYAIDLQSGQMHATYQSVRW